MIASAALHLLLAASAGADAPADAVRSAPEPHVRVSARIIVIDHEAVRRAGVSYVAVGDGRIRVEGAGRRAPRELRSRRPDLGVGAFVELARTHRWVRSEATQDILVLSGSEARLSSSSVTIGGYGARASGPEVTVTPTVLEDGRVHLRVDARMSDVAVDRWGHAVDGSPVSVVTEVVVRDGREAVLASAVVSEATRDVGILFRGRSDRERDVLVILTPHVQR